MRNINRINRARLLSCATIGLVISISPCFAQGNDRNASQEMQNLGTAPPEIMTPRWSGSSSVSVSRSPSSRASISAIMYPSLTGHRPDWPIDPPKAFDPPKDWNTANIDNHPVDLSVLNDLAKNPVLEFTAPKDWFTSPLSPGQRCHLLFCP
jgi:hypothetical protein